MLVEFLCVSKGSWLFLLFGGLCFLGLAKGSAVVQGIGQAMMRDVALTCWTIESWCHVRHILLEKGPKIANFGSDQSEGI
ncbi:hypothetical protein QBC34DRAFT_418545 [Podospora aff. communis PSN243]|uniref:Secreted protein n=1 Tax=Podospora aff. communis PSN243 TaxID=3040156 RepID=A0AAV9G325_9PEZI|nr:hypothetical protein QBC34DRAFT_418545 [Podospora aff. communis PSN243]